MIEIKDISKKFNGNSVIQNITFSIKKGEIVGLLGKNGAGKTTIIRMLLNYYIPDSGSIEINSQNHVKNRKEILEKIGYLPEVPMLYPNLRVVDYLTFIFDLKGSKLSKKDQLEKVLKLAMIEDKRNSIIKNLSKGYKQRVGLAAALITDPEILILDEPTSGLDPIQIKRIFDIISNIKDDKIVIFSTHILSDIERICKRILLVDEGKLKDDKEIKDIVSKHKNVENYFHSMVN